MSNDINPVLPEEPRLVWMDLEMTGLNPDQDKIIEIALLVTDLQLNLIAEGPHLILQQEASSFASMDEWNQKHHSQSGLWAQAVASSLSLAAAEVQVLEFLKQQVARGRGLLAGNSIWQDRRFLIKYMPMVDRYLHYRMVDVSSIKTLVQAWYRNKEFKKKEGHRALADIKESVEELRYYKSHCFLPTDS